MTPFDPVLTRLGEFRLYQWYQYILLGITTVSTGTHTLANVFVVYIPEVYCDVLGLENLTLHEKQRISSPYNINTRKYDYCKTYDVDFTKFNISSIVNSNTTVEHSGTRDCTAWHYSGDIYPNSIVAKWDLVCSNAWKCPAAQSFYMLGFLVGCIVFGALADRLGRKAMLMVSSVMLSVFGIISAFAPEYWSHVAMRFICGASAAGAITCSFVLTMEMIGKAKRMVPGIFFQGWFALGMCLLCIIANFVRNYVHLQIVISVIPLVCIIEYWFIGKSARWLITQGRIPEAIFEVKRAARMNKVTYPADLMPSEDDIITTTEENDKEVKSTATVMDLLRTRHLRLISLNVFFNWFVNSFVYYGLSMGVSNLAGSPFTNLFIFGLLEFPGYMICTLTLDRIGRRVPLAGLMITGGLACILMLAVPDDVQWLRTSFAMLGKLTISGSFAHIYVYSAELFPTVVRNVGVGAGSLHARIGGLVAPFVGILGHAVWPPLPGLIFGSASLTAGLLALLLPETLDQPLPETIADAEKWRSTGFSCRSQRTSALEIEDIDKTKSLLQTNGIGPPDKADAVC